MFTRLDFIRREFIKVNTELACCHMGLLMQDKLLTGKEDVFAYHDESGNSGILKAFTGF